MFKSGDISILIDSIALSLFTISDYVILLGIFIYIFALLGMSQYATILKFDPVTNMPDKESGVPGRTNFSNMG